MTRLASKILLIEIVSQTEKLVYNVDVLNLIVYPKLKLHHGYYTRSTIWKR